LEEELVVVHKRVILLIHELSFLYLTCICTHGWWN